MPTQPQPSPRSVYFSDSAPRARDRTSSVHHANSSNYLLHHHQAAGAATTATSLSRASSTSSRAMFCAMTMNSTTTTTGGGGEPDGGTRLSPSALRHIPTANNAFFGNSHGFTTTLQLREQIVRVHTEILQIQRGQAPARYPGHLEDLIRQAGNLENILREQWTDTTTTNNNMSPRAQRHQAQRVSRSHPHFAWYLATQDNQQRPSPIPTPCTSPRAARRASHGGGWNVSNSRQHIDSSRSICLPGYIFPSPRLGMSLVACFRVLWVCAILVYFLSGYDIHVRRINNMPRFWGVLLSIGTCIVLMLWVPFVVTALLRRKRRARDMQVPFYVRQVALIAIVSALHLLAPVLHPILFSPLLFPLIRVSWLSFLLGITPHEWGAEGYFSTLAVLFVVASLTLAFHVFGALDVVHPSGLFRQILRVSLRAAGASSPLSHIAMAIAAVLFASLVFPVRWMAQVVGHVSALTLSGDTILDAFDGIRSTSTPCGLPIISMLYLTWLKSEIACLPILTLTAAARDPLIPLFVYFIATTWAWSGVSVYIFKTAAITTPATAHRAAVSSPSASLEGSLTPIPSRSVSPAPPVPSYMQNNNATSFANHATSTSSEREPNPLQQQQPHDTPSIKSDDAAPSLPRAATASRSSTPVNAEYPPPDADTAAVVIHSDLPSEGAGADSLTPERLDMTQTTNDNRNVDAASTVSSSIADDDPFAWLLGESAANGTNLAMRDAPSLSASAPNSLPTARGIPPLPNTSDVDCAVDPPLWLRFALAFVQTTIGLIIFHQYCTSK
eukprot:PhM_4_TR16533/c0_g1_i3/m.96742